MIGGEGLQPAVLALFVKLRVFTHPVPVGPVSLRWRYK
jgi:hypothetical protein